MQTDIKDYKKWLRAKIDENNLNYRKVGESIGYSTQSVFAWSTEGMQDATMYALDCLLNKFNSHLEIKGKRIDILEFGYWLRAYLHYEGISYCDFAKKVGLGERFLYNLKKRPTVAFHTLLKILDELNLTIYIVEGKK